MKKHPQKKQLQKTFLGLGGVLLALAASADTTNSPTKVTLTKPEAKSLNRFGMSYRMGFNISAKFTDLGRNIESSGAQYDNGSVGTDNYLNDEGQDNHIAPGDPNPIPGSGNATANWSVANVNQINQDAGTVAMTHTTSTVAGESSSDQDPHYGLELTYNRELGALWGGHWGVEGAFNYMEVCLDNNAPHSGYDTATTTTYSLIPGTQYSFNGPSYTGSPVDNGGLPLIGLDNPSQSGPVQTPTTFPGTRRVSADIYGIRLGPYWEVPLTDQIAFHLSAGLAMAYVASDFSFQDVTPQGTVTGGGSHDDALFGGYVAGNFSLALSEAWSLTAGAQYQNVGKFSQTESDRRVELDLSKSVFFTLGASYSF